MLIYHKIIVVAINFTEIYLKFKDCFSLILLLNLMCNLFINGIFNYTLKSDRKVAALPLISLKLPTLLIIVKSF